MKSEIGLNEERKLKNVISELLESQLGEVTQNVKIAIEKDRIDFTADCIIVPAEQNMMHNDKNRNLFLFYKIKQFNIVKDDFMEKIEKIIQYKVEDSSTQFLQDGTRTITLWIGSRLK